MKKIVSIIFILFCLALQLKAGKTKSEQKSHPTQNKSKISVKVVTRQKGAGKQKKSSPEKQLIVSLRMLIESGQPLPDEICFSLKRKIAINYKQELASLIALARQKGNTLAESQLSSWETLSVVPAPSEIEASRLSYDFAQTSLSQTDDILLLIIKTFTKTIMTKNDQAFDQATMQLTEPTVALDFIQKHAHDLLQKAIFAKYDHAFNKILEWILSGAPTIINQKNALGLTPLHQAVIYRYDHGVQVLVAAGADQTIRDDLMHQTPAEKASLLHYQHAAFSTMQTE